MEEQQNSSYKKCILSLNELDDILSCPIHLGILDHPLQLPCGHSFCLKCIENCLKTKVLENNLFICPVCRTKWPVPSEGACGWSQSFVLNNVISYIQEHKRKMSYSSSENNQQGSLRRKRKNSFIEKIDFMKSLVEEISETNSNDDSIDKSFLITELNTTLQKLTSNLKSDNSDNRSTFELEVETEKTQKQMKMVCEYQIISKSLPQKIYEEFVNSLNKDCADINEDSQLRKFIFVNSIRNVIIYDYDLKTRTSFAPRYHKNCVKPLFLRFFQGYIFISALIYQKNGSTNTGILIKYDLNGNMLNSSQKFTNKNNDYFPIYGFDIDMQGNIYVTHPDINTITIMTFDFKEKDDKFVFTDSELRPKFVCYSQSTKELWLSCPGQKSVAILDTITGNYVHFRTSQLFNSEPSHIVSTKDNKICFRDSKSSCVYWIKKQDQYICIQRLSFKTSPKLTNLVLLQGFCNSISLLLISDKSIFIAKPFMNFKDNVYKAYCCTMI